MRNELAAPLRTRLLAVVLTLALTFSLSPIGSALALDNAATAEQVAQFTCSANGAVIAAKDIVTTAGTYAYTPYGGTESLYDLKTVTLPADTTQATLTFDQNVLVYAYDKNGTYLASYLDTTDENALYTGETSFTVKTDSDGDGIIDYLFVQNPYAQDWSGGDLLYVITFTNAGAATPKEEGPADTPKEDESDIVAVFSATDLATLEANLSARFAKGGSDAALAKNTYAAALGLGAQGQASTIDTDALLAAMNEDTALTAGALAKYMLALNAAGVDCTAVNDSGTTRNLVSELETLTTASDQDIWSAVCVLPALDFTSKGTANQEVTDALIKTILTAQNEDGLFGGSGYYDSQTTAQAIMALAPHTNNASVTAALASAQNALLTLQQVDGGFAYSSGDTTSNLDATANLVAALAAVGIDAASLTSSTGNDPLGYLIAMADDDLSGYTKNSSWDEPMTSATVLEGIAAYRGYLSKGTAFNIYDASSYPAPEEDGAEPYVQDDTTNESQNNEAANSASESSSTATSTGDSASPFAVGGIIVLAILAAGVLMARDSKRKLNE